MSGIGEIKRKQSIVRVFHVIYFIQGKTYLPHTRHVTFVEDVI